MTARAERRESATPRLSAIAGCVRLTATIVCSISWRRKIAVRHIGKNFGRDVRSAAGRVRSLSTAA